MLATALSESSQQEPQEMMHGPGLRPIHSLGVSLNSHTSSGVSLNSHTSSANVPLSHHCLLRASYAPMAARFLRPPVLSPSHFQRPACKITTVATTVAGLAEDTGRGYKTTKDVKAALYQELEGTNRGIFGMASAKKSAILDMVELLESQNPTPQPTDYLLDKVDGCWKLIYSSITILGVKRTKLGLRDFINLGDFIQIIDAAKGRAVNVIEFNVRGFNMLTGQLTIEASFEIASKTRVNIKLENSHITPEQLKNLFQKNYDLLLAIFNPEGWLEITYVDDSMRIGRDDKGNVFVVERSELEKF